MTRIERVTSPLPRECSTTEPHGRIRRAGPHEPLIYKNRDLHINFALLKHLFTLYNLHELLERVKGIEPSS